MEMNGDVQARLEQLAKLSTPIKAGILLGIGLAIGFAYYFFFYQAMAIELQSHRATELELQRKLSEVRSIAANLTSFQEEISELELELSEIIRQLPNKKELEVLLTDLSNLGKKSGVEIKSFRRKNEVMHNFYAEVPINLSLEGEFHNIARFFDLMAKLPRIVNMGSLDIKVEKENEVATRLKVSGTATAFRFVGDDEKS